MADATSLEAAWEQAGEAWGARALDWACLAEGLGRPAYHAVFAATSIGQGTGLLDIACGAGMAASIAAARGARVAGLDASAALLDIAQERVPSGEFRRGDMAALPWSDATFDVVTSFNGIWAGNEAALREARRVVRTGGLMGFAFFGPPEEVEHVPLLVALAGLMPPRHAAAGASLLEISRPGAAEERLKSAGFTPCERGSVLGVSEWPDDEVAMASHRLHGTDLGGAAPQWGGGRTLSGHVGAGAVRD